MPVVGYVNGRGREDSIRYGDAFHKGLTEAGIIEGQNAAVEYHWLDGQYDQLRALTADRSSPRYSACNERAAVIRVCRPIRPIIRVRLVTPRLPFGPRSPSK
jgi:hypothetical protein